MPPILPCSEFRLLFSVEDPPSLPRYAGSAWRGALGHALKMTVCVVRDTTCPKCMLYRSCPYPYVFETPPPPESQKMRRYNAAPHPFVLAMHTSAEANTYPLGLTLIGKAHGLLPYLVHAFDQAGAAGIGGSKQVFRLQSLLQRSSHEDPALAWQTIYAPGQALRAENPFSPAIPAIPRKVRIQLETPLRLRQEEHLVTPANFRFADLFRSLLRRISLLSYFHTDAPLETDFAGLTERAQAVDLHDAHLRWWDWTRYSSRQGTEMQMGGVLGEFVLDGSELEEFWPYLWIGQWTHAGKSATMGLGRYQIDSASLP